MARRKAQRNERGSVFPLKSTGGFRAKYLNPVLPGRYVVKNFKPGQKLIAENWLARELDYANDCERTGKPYRTPQEREREREAESVSFREYAERYVSEHRKADGTPLAAASMRKIRVSVKHLTDYFGDTKLVDITPKAVDDFLADNKIPGEGGHALRRAYQALKAIMTKATKPDNGHAPLMTVNPCQRPAPEGAESQQARIPEATPEELTKIVAAMPEQYRIAPLVQVTFALRISELCALQVKDFDFKHHVLHIRHALRRSGSNDRGPLELAPTKTRDSSADMPIPDAFIPQLQAHIREHTNARTDPNAMFLRAREAHIIHPNTLRDYFKEACKAAGRPDLHTHTLRATGISVAARNGTPKETQLYGRHDDPKISLGLYQRANSEGLQRVSSAVFDTFAPRQRTVDVVRRELEDANKQLEVLTVKRDALADELKEMEAENG